MTSNDLCVTFDPYPCTSYMKGCSTIVMTKFGIPGSTFVREVAFLNIFFKHKCNIIEFALAMQGGIIKSIQINWKKHIFDGEKMKIILLHWWFSNLHPPPKKKKKIHEGKKRKKEEKNWRVEPVRDLQKITGRTR